MERLLDLTEAGALFGLNRKKMYELTCERSQMRRKVRMPTIRLGKRIMFREASLLRGIEALERQGGGQ